MIPRGAMAEPQSCSVAVVVVAIDGPEAEKGSGRFVVDVGESDPEGEKLCRICHLSSDPGEDGQELIELGCGCKGELGVAHRRCAEAWFSVKGSRCYEICGANAKNITGADDIKFMEKWHEGREVNSSINTSSRSSCCWRRLFCNLLMACLVAAFIVPWLFRVNMF